MSVALKDAFENAKRGSDHIALARRAWQLAASSPDFGDDVRRRLVEGVVAWPLVCLTVVVTDDGVGVSIGNERIDLHGALERLEPGRSSRGSGGVWPNVTLH